MKKLNLGSVLLTIFFSIKAFGGVDLILDTPAIYKGNIAQITIRASGDNIVFPDIKEIGGYEVNGVSSSSQTNYINGKISKILSKSFIFKPNNNVKIPSFNIKIDGKEYKTQEQEIKVLKPEASKSGDEFILDAIFEKDNLIVGESVNFNLLFKRRLDAKFDNLRLDAFDVSNLNFQQVGDVKTYTEGNYIVEKISFLVTALKPADYEIPPFSINVGNMISGGFFPEFKWKKVYSNSNKLNVGSLPSGIINFGKFSIKAFTDKNEVEPNEPVNLTLEIEGFGNIDDIEKFSLKLKDAMVYSDKADVKVGLKENKFGGKFIQKFALISDKNYTIPSFYFKFLDKDTKEIKTIKTDNIQIIVNSKNIMEKPKIETMDKNIVKSETIVKTEYKNNYLNLILGFALGFFVYFLIIKFKDTKSNKINIALEDLIRKSKTNKELFDILLPYAKKDETIDEILKKLEDNLYKGLNHNIDKKKLIEAVQKYFYVNE